MTRPAAEAQKRSPRWFGAPLLRRSLLSRRGLRCAGEAAFGSAFSIMRRRFVGRAGGVSLGLLDPLAQAHELSGQRIDLAPLFGDGLVQRLDGFVLKHQAGLQGVDALAKR